MLMKQQARDLCPAWVLPKVLGRVLGCVHMVIYFPKLCKIRYFMLQQPPWLPGSQSNQGVGQWAFWGFPSLGTGFLDVVT